MDSGRVGLVGVEEEFHVIDLESRHAVPEVDSLLAGLPEESFGPELQRSVVESNSRPTHKLEELRDDLTNLRAQLAGAGELLGLGVVSAGTVPLMPDSAVEVYAGDRYQRMHTEYQMLAREQIICGTQVHVDVPDRDTAVAVLQHLAPALPMLLALTASSPYWRGHDSGYASCRSLIWSRWPTAGPPGPVSSAAQYDRLIGDLVASGTISDPGMVYFDVRPSAHLSTVELRICDACPSVDEVVLVAGLFRALVRQSLDRIAADAPLPGVRHEMLRAATWRAARAGLEGDLVDLRSPGLVPPTQLLWRTIGELREHLEEAGDYELVSELADAALAKGSAAARQRRTFGRRGELQDVVDALLDETQGRSHVDALPVQLEARPALLAHYRPAGFDEVVGAGGGVRTHYAWMVRALGAIGMLGLADRAVARDIEQRARKVTFRVGDDDEDRLFPLDLVPRMVTAAEWRILKSGLAQRVRALEAFLQDVYGAQQCFADGLVDHDVMTGAAGWSEAGRLVPPGTIRAMLCGIDLVRDDRGRWLVLEDNLRVPSGIGYAMTSRRLIRSVLPELEPPGGVVGLDTVPAMLREALGGTSAALLTSGPRDAAFFEHSVLAEQMGVLLVTPGELTVENGHVRHPISGSEFDVLYRRIDEDELMSSEGVDGKPLGPALLTAMGCGAVRICNAFGNGVADDKFTYCAVPAMIEYYLAERPLLPGVGTFRCGVPEELEQALDRAGELVHKPVDGFGGAGIVIGPEASRAELEAVIEKIRAVPQRWVSQETVSLSTHPTVGDKGLEPRAVDLRAFVLGGPTPAVLPALLTRVAPAGTMVVNSSRGGGAKDTWVLR